MESQLYPTMISSAAPPSSIHQAILDARMEGQVFDRFFESWKTEISTQPHLKVYEGMVGSEWEAQVVIRRLIADGFTATYQKDISGSWKVSVTMPIPNEVRIDPNPGGIETMAPDWPKYSRVSVGKLSIGFLKPIFIQAGIGFKVKPKCTRYQFRIQNFTGTRTVVVDSAIAQWVLENRARMDRLRIRKQVGGPKLIDRTVLELSCDLPTIRPSSGVESTSNSGTIGPAIVLGTIVFFASSPFIALVLLARRG